MLAGTALGMVGLGALNWWGLVTGRADLEESRLLRRQLDRLAAAPAVDVLLLGDSTLGNAVDEAGWNAATGRQVLALPLAGNFGYEGTLNMLRRAVRAGHRPGLVVIMHSIEIAAREPAPMGALLTAQSWRDLEDVRPLEVAPQLLSAELAAGILASLGRDVEGPPMTSGYVPQRADVAPAEVRAGQRFLTPDDLKDGKLDVLGRIGGFCRRAGLRCVMLHGPYLDPACSAARDYLAALDRRLRAQGLAVAERSPLCFPLPQAGDTPDHVSPAAKARFSERYRAMVLGPGVLASDG